MAPVVAGRGQVQGMLKDPGTMQDPLSGKIPDTAYQMLYRDRIRCGSDLSKVRHQDDGLREVGSGCFPLSELRASVHRRGRFFFDRLNRCRR